MAYRINVQFKDGSTNGPFADVVADAPPRYGDTLSISRHGADVPVRVTAVWTPAARVPDRGAAALIMVEAREI